MVPRKIESEPVTRGGAIRVGVNLIKQLSDAFYSRKNMVVEELVTNAYDAMASKVAITISPKEVIIEDDGEGMTPEELVRFFYISYTEKARQKFKVRDKQKRYVIGKFGIAKLSIYQIARSFEITTWKADVESEATFHFDDLEKREFIDELKLTVTGRPAHHASGTRLRLFDLREGKQLDARELPRYLPQRLALGPQFTIIVNGKRCATTDDLPAKIKFDINENDVPGVGKVTGEVRYLDKLPESRSGIYIKVRGRVVNHNPRIMDLSNLVSAKSLSRKTYGVLEVDSLEDAIQTNRGGFVEDNEKYVALLKWLGTKLNGLNRQALPVFTAERKEKEAKELPGRLAIKLQANIGPIESIPLHTITKNEKDSKEASNQTGQEKDSRIQKTEFEDAPSIQIGKQRVAVLLKGLGPENPEAEYDDGRKAILINSDHPMYEDASSRRCLEYHGFKAAAVALAVAFSNNLNEFKKNYEAIIRG